MKIRPAEMVAIMMARGTPRRGSLASSDSVDTASNPRNDRHRIAAPASTGPRPVAVPSPVNGAARSTLPPPNVSPSASTTNVTMKIACTAMIRKLARATDTMPTMLSTVTKPIATSTITHSGSAGSAALR